ncbi:hypothetical protein PR202_ga17838 [Eleusine coracana subsp. coracana]|uniref:Uncharacterized protein n=1 Tax=Eleusine coracana subsp. coracana TaxID=191504 RepID=A0AAV5CRZ0_ELECO|nr:hypothetical protein PR202_ga17838 [Eleusine coracana subsp. coracana]
MIPTIIVAMGAAAVGAPDALRFLLGFAGRSPAVDISLCVFAIAVATTAVLGAMLLARHIHARPAPAGRGGCVRGRSSGISATSRCSFLASVVNYVALHHAKCVAQYL